MFTRYQILQPKRVCLYSFFFFLVPEVTESKAETSPVIDDTFDFTDAPLEVAFSYFHHQLWWFWLRTVKKNRFLLGCILFFFFFLGYWMALKTAPHLPVEVITWALVSVVALPRCWRKLHWIGRLMVRASCCPWLAFWRCWRFWLRCTVWSTER